MKPDELRETVSIGNKLYAALFDIKKGEGMRDSVNNLIRSDKPESPTDLIFIAGGLALIGLWIYATQTGKPIAGITEILLFLAGCKGIKAGSDYSKRKAVQNVDTSGIVEKTANSASPGAAV